MQYRIEGQNLPVLLVHLEAGESIQCEGGAMAWMDDGIEMSTSAGGFGKALGRMFSREAMFMNNYTARTAGEIAFNSKFPGNIRAVEIKPGSALIVQKGSFLACTPGVSYEVYFQKRLGNMFFGGEGLIMEKFTGSGLVFLEIDGSAYEYELAAGQRKILDTGYLVAMTESCSMDVVTVKGVKNALFGGEGFFNTVVSGPGRIIVQSMPIASTAMVLYGFMPHGNS
ncbi:MAG: TIGR00266 family protein [Eubacterium sp.]|nr:TIGR00266 family protein [Eubacterium sp.]